MIAPRSAVIVALSCAAALAGCDPVEDCTPGQFEVFRNPAQYMVFFEAGSSLLSEKARKTLTLVLESAAKPLATTIDVVGHTDATGASDVNLNLSRRRAEVVRDALVAKGIAPSRISVVARGASWPLVQTSSANADNRRAEITVKIPVSEQAVGYLSCRDGFRRIQSTTDPR